MTKRVSPARSVLVAAFVLLALTLVPVALAGKGGNGGGGGSTTSGGGHHGGGGGGTTSTSTLSGPVMVTDLNGDGLPNHRDSITFDVSTTATSTPEVGLRCYQGSAWVLDGYVGYWSGYEFTPYFTLDSGYWVDGVEASCTARLFYYDKRGREQDLATLSFSVAP
jgi:hypothetical protein